VGRIRCIKPEFPASESMGNVSRESRLLFIQLWTLADDSGRLRGNPRYLAHSLYPYDDDAERHIDLWLRELEAQECIRRYRHGRSSLIAIANWSLHQRIDHPKPSRFSEPPAAEQSDFSGYAVSTDAAERQPPIRMNGGRA
jgi:hypothetical protein